MKRRRKGGLVSLKVSRRSKKATSGRNRCFGHSVDSLLPVRAKNLKKYLDVWVCWRCERSKVMASALVVVALERVLGDALAALHPFYGKVKNESNCPVGVHPLPLPPAAATPLPSAPTPQPIAELESLPINSQWQKGKFIGRGSFGSVYVATNRVTGALCAMKEIELFPNDPKSAECEKQLKQEIEVLSQLKHPNIVKYYGSEKVNGRFRIYLEYVPCSISKYVHEHGGAIPESVVRNFTRHILSGLAYLHSTKTIHRDIKGANLLVDFSGVVKLADFGVAKHLTGQAAELSLKGSAYWIAPELMQPMRPPCSDVALAADIWSLGCTIIEMVTGKPPWRELEWVAAMYKVSKHTPRIPETLSSEGKDFLRCCFQRLPEERPSAAMLLEHPFVKNSDSWMDHLATDHLSGRT